MSWQAVIGLEIHVQLATQSKLFSAAPTAYGAEANTQTSWLDAALPGTLPVPNREAVRLAATFGLAIDAEIAERSIFARKNYFYPDLPKGYQISQYETPIVGRGYLDVRMEDGRMLRVEIVRAHMEEDAGKSLHDAFHGATGIDLNRAGTPLIEIVSAPCLHSPEEAVAYLRTVHQLVRWLGVSDGNMQEGSFRCDANVSVRPSPDAPLGTRCEIKNVNSFRFVEKAIAFEIERQIRALENGETIVQETRLYDAAANRTRPMRSKEDAEDYRYFPDPDLPPIVLAPGELDELRETLPELPWQRASRYQDVLKLSAYDAHKLTEDRALSDYFESVLAVLLQSANADRAPHVAKQAANWINGELASALNDAELDITGNQLAAAELAQLIIRIEDGTLSGKLAKEVFQAIWAGEGTVDQVIAQRGLQQVTDTGAIDAMLAEVLAQYPDQVAKFRSGDQKIFQFLVGQAMKATKGKANPALVNERLRQALGSA